MSVAANRIPAEVLAEQWFSFKHGLLEKLQRFFQDHNLRQEDIADRIGKDPALISRWLRGRQNMNLRTMHDLARGMGCRLRIELDPLDKMLPANRRSDERWTGRGGTPDNANTFRKKPDEWPATIR